ncbi:MAG: hypothetical protein R3293_09330 [Candidatus Promineifilaceae bacterium]|nr:hypothetical protein [Candidatus Promineifilaceae bacterium]
MSESTVPVICKTCGSSEMNVPVLQTRYMGESFWICSRCLPTLIHQPQRLAGILANADKIPATDHEH